MSISTALSNAVSGLTAVSRSAELVSANVANAMTEGYGRRELTLGTAALGGGVTVAGIDRIVNEAALADRRISDAALGYHQSRAAFFSDIERAVGVPGTEGSLSAHVAVFDQSIIVAAANPASDIYLSGVLDSATELATKFNSISDKLQAERQRIDAGIGSQVSQLNRALEDVNDLNKKIQHQTNSGGNTAGLMDQRQLVIDQISELIPIQSVPRDFGKVALLTQNGTTLVDYRAAQFEFTPTPVITPDQSIASGALSGLSLSGTSSSNGSALESVSGGALAAAFVLRDGDIPALQNDLDALALDLSQRASGADGSLSSGIAGFFTDGGNVATDTDIVGLSGRLQVNPILNPSLGGDLWRIRDGVSAGVEGEVGDSTFLNRFAGALGELSLPVAGAFTSAGSVGNLIGELLSKVGQDKQASLTRQNFQAARSDAFRDLELQGGVDTDQEMQKLLLIEQNFSANAKIIQAVDEMLQSLLRI